MSRSAYRSQDIRDEKSSQPPCNRLLLLNVTDGVIELQAMEYKQIPLLSLSTKPGVKVSMFVFKGGDMSALHTVVCS